MLQQRCFGFVKMHGNIKQPFSNQTGLMPMLKKWTEQYFENAQLMFLLFILISVFGILWFAGDILTPIFASLVIAYVLDGGISFLEARSWPRGLALALIYCTFIGFVGVCFFGIIPVLSQEIANFLGDLPSLIKSGKVALMGLPEQYPEFIQKEHIDYLVNELRAETVNFGQKLLNISLSSVTGFLTILIYMVIVPLLIFFLLFDKNKILAWWRALLPRRESHRLTEIVWSDVNAGFAGYIRGKLIEIAIMWVVSWIAFAILGLSYAPLLSFLVGLSVIVPFLGAIIVTIPIVMVAYAQWGLDSYFIYTMIVYGVLQFLDGNVLVPLLFSEVVDIHPIAIICAVLIFGSIWGLWGVFFAIPLATLVNAIIKAWPRETLSAQQ